MAKRIDIFSDEFPIEKRLLKAYKAAFVEIYGKKRSVNREYFYPSNLNCERAMYFQQVADIPDKADQFGMLEVSEYGNNRHEIIQSIFFEMKNLGYPFEWVNVSDYVEKHKKKLSYLEVFNTGDKFETKVIDHKHHVSYRSDGLLYDTVTKKYYILEIKTEGHQELTEQNTVLQKHIRQITSYCNSFQIFDYVFFYESRGFLSKQVFFGKVKPKQRKELIERIEKVKQNIHDKEIPDFPADLEKNQKFYGCAYCNYQKVCMKEGIKNETE